MKKLKEFYNKICIALKRQYIFRLAVSLRSKKHDTRLLKTMDDYKINFDLDSKIAWNRHRMRELFEMYKKIENYYPLFFAFLGFLGIYYFDFIVFLINGFDCLFLLSTILTSVGLIWALYYMTQIMFGKNWCQDYDPKEVYGDLFDKKTVSLKKIEPDCTLQDIELEVRENYLFRLENNVSNNFNTYSKKKTQLGKLLKIMLITILIYSFNIVHFKNMTMAKTNDETKPKITVEGFERKTTTLTGDEVRQIVNEEIENYFEKKKQSELNEGIKQMKKNSK